jgi:hypothetical protein
MRTKAVGPLLATLALAVAATQAHAQRGVARNQAQSEQRVVVPLSDPSRPAILDVSIFSGDVSVAGYDGSEIVIVADTPVRDADEPVAPRADGLRQIQSSSVDLVVEEADNTVSLRMGFSPRSAHVEVMVPRRTSVHAHLVNGGDVTVTSVTGDHELANVNGGVIATDISGSAVINCTNGDIQATFVAVAPDKPMSFTSFNGDVDVSLPANLAADLLVASQQGDVFTDFDVQPQQAPTVVDRNANAGRYRVRMQRNTSYAIGGGGVDIALRTFNGDIMIRKR